MILPSHTYLESWGDDFPEPGVGFRAGAISQPVVSPLYDTRDTGDTLAGGCRAVNPEGGLTAASTEEYLRDRWRAISDRDGALKRRRRTRRKRCSRDRGSCGPLNLLRQRARWPRKRIRPVGCRTPSDEFWNSVLRAGVWGENTRAEPAAVTVDASVIDSIGVDAPEFSGSSDAYPFICTPIFP